MKGIVDFWLLNQRNLELRYDASDFKIEQDARYRSYLVLLGLVYVKVRSTTYVLYIPQFESQIESHIVDR